METTVLGSRISSNLFGYSSAHKEFTIDASDLPKTFEPMSQIWNDSADVGFIMFGHAGKGMIFVFKSEERDNEGDITEWLFEADPFVNDEFGLDYTIKAAILND